MQTNTVSYYGAWGQVAQTRINNAGKVTRTAKKVFTQGQCHALALALHDLAGLQLVGVYTGADNYPLDKPSCIGEGETLENFGIPSHTAVQLDTGTVLDIEGIDAQNHKQWYGCAVVPLTKDEVIRFTDYDYLPPDIEAAKPFARELLKRYGIEPFVPEVKP